MIMPFLISRKALEARGLECTLSDSPRDTHYLIVTSEWIRHRGLENNREGTAAALASLRQRCHRLVFFDMTDPASVIFSYVLPYVHAYWKPYLLRDRKQYRKPFYQSRIFAEYYRTRFGVEDKISYPTYDAVPDGELKKLFLAWNYQFYLFGALGRYRRALRDYALFVAPRILSARSFRFSERRCRPVTMRVSINYPLESVAYQRRMTAEILRHRGIDSSPVAPKIFYHELRSSKISVSPFGWGEICIRDFESILNGCALLKPRIDHLETFPQIFEQDVTFAAFDWDGSDLLQQIDSLLVQDRWRTIAENAQREYVGWTDRRTVALRLAERIDSLLRSTDS